METACPPSDAEHADGKTRFELSHWPREPEALRVRERSFAILYPCFISAPIEGHAIGEATISSERSFLTQPGFLPHVGVSEAREALSMFLGDTTGSHYYLLGAGILRRRQKDGVVTVDCECYPILAPDAEKAFHVFIDIQAKPGFEFLGAKAKMRRYERSEIYSLQAGSCQRLRPIFIKGHQIQRTFQ